MRRTAPWWVCLALVCACGRGQPDEPTLPSYVRAAVRVGGYGYGLGPFFTYRGETGEGTALLAVEVEAVLRERAPLGEGAGRRVRALELGPSLVALGASGGGLLTVDAVGAGAGEPLRLRFFDVTQPLSPVEAATELIPDSVGHRAALVPFEVEAGRFLIGVDGPDGATRLLVAEVVDGRPAIVSLGVAGPCEAAVVVGARLVCFAGEGDGDDVRVYGYSRGGGLWALLGSHRAPVRLPACAVALSGDVVALVERRALEGQPPALVRVTLGEGGEVAEVRRRAFPEVGGGEALPVCAARLDAGRLLVSTTRGFAVLSWDDGAVLASEVDGRLGPGVPGPFDLDARGSYLTHDGEGLVLLELSEAGLPVRVGAVARRRTLTGEVVTEVY